MFVYNIHAEDKTPVNLESALEYLNNNWTEEQKIQFQMICEENIIKYTHLSIGMGIRNAWKLWEDNKLTRYFNDLGIIHADDMSSIILLSFHRKLNRKDIELEEQIKSREFYIVSEQMPKYPGGTEGLIKFLDNNFRYSNEMIDLDLTGKVFINFIVNTDGTISNVNVIKSLHKSFDDECIRIVKKFPKWSCGMQNNIPVRISYNLQFNFENSQLNNKYKF